MTQEKKPLWLRDLKILRDAYNTLYQEGQVSFPLVETHIQKLESIVKTVYAEYYQFPRFVTLQDKAAAYFYFIIKDHPMTDGNKRLSVLWLETYAVKSKLKLNPALPLDVFAITIEQEKEASFEEIHQKIKETLFM